MTDLPEPPNRSIVAWGGFANQVRIRIDEWVPEGSDANWYPADDNSPYEPTNWVSLTAAMRHYGTPYLLARQDLPPAAPDPASAQDTSPADDNPDDGHYLASNHSPL